MENKHIGLFDQESWCIYPYSYIAWFEMFPSWSFQHVRPKFRPLFASKARHGMDVGQKMMGIYTRISWSIRVCLHVLIPSFIMDPDIRPLTTTCCHSEATLVVACPASNMDSILMNWSVQEQAKTSPVSLHQRDCFAAAFMERAHHISRSVMSKMTTTLHLTDTDFSHQFKAWSYQ